MNQLEQRLKVGIVAPYPPFRGGIAHFTAQFHVNLEPHVAQVTGVSFSRQYPSWLFPGSSQFSSEPSSEIEAPALLDSLNPWTWKKTANYLVSNGLDEVVFMVWMPFFAPAFLGIIRYLRKHNIRVTALVHNVLPHKKQPFGALLTRTLLNQCDRVIALSETVRKDVQALDLKRKADVEMYPHPIYNQFGDPVPKTEARKQLNLPLEGPVVLFFGLVRAYKGLDVLLQAFFSVNPNIRLVVAGEWYEDHDRLKKLMADPRISDRIVCHNAYIPDSEVKYYFSAADVLVQPYRSATQSGVVQTALHFDLPSIVTEVGGLPEMIVPNESGFVVPPENPERLATAINTFFEGDTSTRMIQATKALKSESSWEHFVSGFLNR